jgi:arsenite methyltransferase
VVDDEDTLRDAFAMTAGVSTERAVAERYALAAAERQEALCCPVNYDPQYLKAIPQEVLEKDYGCGDPSRHLHPGEVVLDLGSGAGKICFIAAQVVGKSGKVIGIDMTDEMLEVARRNAPLVANNLGYANVEFRKGRIQDLALDLELVERELQKSPVLNANDYVDFERRLNELRATKPLVATGSIDVVVSNCVLNLVEPNAKEQLFREIYRVLKPGGRAVISDIVGSREVDADMQRDPELWSGCISGAFTEEAFPEQFRIAGFVSVEILARQEKPWRIVQDIEFRSVTICAWKDRKVDLPHTPARLELSGNECCPPKTKCC